MLSRGEIPIHAGAPWRWIMGALSLLAMRGLWWVVVGGGGGRWSGGSCGECLALEQCKASTIFPLWESGADFACWDPAPTQAKVCRARIMAMLSLVLTYPHLCEYECCHFLASLPPSRLANVCALRPSSPSTEQTKGVK
jgi:hypothetical protein